MDAASNRLLTDATETLLISASLPTSAGNDVQGASLELGWLVDATEAAAT
jgi:hypothetical protein